MLNSKNDTGFIYNENITITNMIARLGSACFRSHFITAATTAAARMNSEWHAFKTPCLRALGAAAAMAATSQA